MSDFIRLMKMAVDPNAFENKLAVRIEEMNNRSNFEVANRFQDFVEFLSDVYMEPGEFNACWEQFETWEQNEQPTTLDKQKTKQK